MDFDLDRAEGGGEDHQKKIILFDRSCALIKSQSLVFKSVLADGSFLMKVNVFDHNC